MLPVRVVVVPDKIRSVAVTAPVTARPVGLTVITFAPIVAPPFVVT